MVADVEKARLDLLDRSKPRSLELMAYPGMYVPKSLEIGVAETDEAPRKFAEEILALTKAELEQHTVRQLAFNHDQSRATRGWHFEIRD